MGEAHAAGLLGDDTDLIPTYITSHLLWPGVKMPTGPVHEDYAPLLNLIEHDGFALIDNEALGGFIYAPDRPESERVIKLDDIKLDDIKVIDDKLTEPLFIVKGVTSLRGGYTPYGDAVNWMADSDWADVEHAMDGLHEIAKRRFVLDNERENEKRRREDDPLDAEVCFIGLWSEIMGAGDWEYGGLPELDGFEFEGEGKVVSI